jgi:hypothetical protein
MKLFVTAGSKSSAKRTAPASARLSGAPEGAAGQSPADAGQSPAGAGRWPLLEPSRLSASRCLVDQIGAGLSDDPGTGGWSSGTASQGHWDPGMPRAWRCWAQTGPTWSAHCGAEVVASDPLGLCYRHRLGLLEKSPEEDGVAVLGGPRESLRTS